MKRRFNRQERSEHKEGKSAAGRLSLKMATSHRACFSRRVAGRVTPCAPPFANQRVLIRQDGAPGMMRPAGAVPCVSPALNRKPVFEGKRPNQ